MHIPHAMLQSGLQSYRKKRNYSSVSKRFDPMYHFTQSTYWKYHQKVWQYHQLPPHWPDIMWQTPVGGSGWTGGLLEHTKIARWCSVCQACFLSCCIAGFITRWWGFRDPESSTWHHLKYYQSKNSESELLVKWSASQGIDHCREAEVECNKI